MNMNFFNVHQSSRTTGCPRKRNSGKHLWKKGISAALCAAMLCGSIGGTVAAAEIGVPAPGGTQSAVEIGTTPAASMGGKAGEQATTAAAVGSEKEFYILHLTHYFRFNVNGAGRNISVEETLRLTEADFENGVCDLSRFAYDTKQLMVTEAKPLSAEQFGQDHEGGARIVYAVNSGWQIVPVSKARSQGTVLRDVFQGELSDYEFVPANIVRVNVEYKYSNTGGLANIDAAAPQIVEALPVKQDDQTWQFEFSLPEVTGFRIVLDPAPLNKYLVSPPTGEETPEELQEKLANNDFSVDIARYCIYAYQEQSGRLDAEPDYTVMNPKYNNQYSTEYNEAWNEARILTVDEGCTAAAICGMDHGGADEDHGASALSKPRLKVTMTEEQLQNVMENGLHLTVNYRRNATWYTVNHWVPKQLCGLSDDEIKDRETRELEDGEGGKVTYVLLDEEQMQGRVGGLTRASAKTGGAYDVLVALPFSQKLVQNAAYSNSNEGTTVDIYYREADSYRVIFDTDYTYIPRRQVKLGETVDFSGITEPKRQGYRFGGWQYLKKGAVAGDNGEYADGDYEQVPQEDGVYHLVVNGELVSQKAQLKETGGVVALHLYPKWIPDETQVTVILWTEDLDMVTDVSASAEGGNSDYYNEKYSEYQTEPETHHPVPRDRNTNYSNVASFTMSWNTDGSLVEESDAKKLADALQEEVVRMFDLHAREAGAASASNFYTQDSFEILHETGGVMDYSTTTADADGRTMVYVYFTRNIYTLRFHYYGMKDGTYQVSVGTNGYTYSGGVDDTGSFNFSYSGGGSTGPDKEGNYTSWNNQWRIIDDQNPSNLPVPETITIKAKYGADLRDVWPVTQPSETVNNGGVRVCSWATTAGPYRDEALDPDSSHYYEATLMGLYATMDEQIIADPAHPEKVHDLVAYWSVYELSHYRYNHCFEVPGLKIDSEGIEKISLYGEGDDAEKRENTLYLVPVDNEEIQKYGFTDLMKVSYEDGQITYDDGGYYAVRGYEGDDHVIRYYALGRQVQTISDNAIIKQNPSARAHMTRVNEVADHTTEYTGQTDGQCWGGGKPVGSETDPYDLYFYYDRDRYKIIYMAPKSVNAEEEDTQIEVELGEIELPYGTHVTEALYSFPLDYRDTNQATDAEGNPKYRWSYPKEGDKILSAVAVCPDRNPNGVAEWKFKGWGLGPAGVNMQWEMKGDDPFLPQGQADPDFYIQGDLLLYAIWETPALTVTFHLNGGQVSDRENLEISIPANTRFTAAGTIPRPFRDGYVMDGWYRADENGAPLGTTEEYLFDFDSIIIKDEHVVALWTPTVKEAYSYQIYYVTKRLYEADQDKVMDQVRIDRDGNIVDQGGELYYVLNRETYENQQYVADTVLNLTAKNHPGYVPKTTNQTLELKDQARSYYVFFYYEPLTTGQHTVNFVEAKTETTDNPVVVMSLPAAVDQTVATPPMRRR